MDRFPVTETIAEDWTGGMPVSAGWHERVRIVKTPFKSGLVRIEENVEIVMDAGAPKAVRSTVIRAADAKHLLVSEAHAADLATAGITATAGRNPHYLRVEIDQPQLTASLPALLGKLGALGMKGVEPDFIVETSAQASDPIVGQGLAWHLDNLGLLPGQRAGADINAQAAWDRRTDASQVLIALIDSGISANDPELAPSIRLLPGETLGDGIDNDGNGYIDDAAGYDFYHDDADPEDECGHGSMCAALIGAEGNNGSGSSGVAWQASILNCKFMDADGLGTLSDALDAIEYARISKAKILNLSWSYNGGAALLTEELARCDEQGILMVCASGNSGYYAPVPAPASIRLKHLVTVAASTPGDTLASFSVVDPYLVDLAAPGVDLPIALSATPWNPWGEVYFASGTSFSAALVSGGLALGLAEFPESTPYKVLRRMLETTDPLAGGSAALSSGGRLNLGKMLGPVVLPVPHDTFADRGLFTDASGQWTGRNDGAGTEAIDGSLGLSPSPSRTLWFDWTAPSDGLLRIGARAADGSPVRLSVFSHAGGLPSTLVARSATGEVLEIPVVTGKKLFWLLDSAVEIKQGLQISWQLPPVNDNWRDATPVEGQPLTLVGNTLGATVENFEKSKPHQLWLPQGGVWWKWQPTATATVEIPAVPGHVVFVLPLDDGKPKFSATYEYDAMVRRQWDVNAGHSYAILVVPLTPAAAGPFKVAVLGLKDISILIEPADVAALVCESAELAVEVAAAEPPAYQWFKDGEAIPFSTGPTLKLNPVVAQSYGEYHVVIRSASSVLESRHATVFPRRDVPRLVGQTPRRLITTGDAIDLSATFRSSGKPPTRGSRTGLHSPRRKMTASTSRLRRQRTRGPICW